MSDNTKRNQHGFTLTELVITVTVMGVLLVAMGTISVNYLVMITRNNIVAEMTADSQNLLRSTVEQLRYGAGVRQTNTIADGNAPGGGWTTSDTNFVIIIATPALDSDGEYIIDTDTGEPYNNELVYFKSGDILYRRTLADPEATGNSVKTTCPEAASSSSCPPDVELVEHLDDMQFTLYDQDNNSTTDALLARSVKIDLSMERDTFGDPLTLDNSIRVTLRNNFQ